MRNGPVVGAAVAAFVIFAVIYLVISAATRGVSGSSWAVAVVGGVFFAVVAALVAVAVSRRRSGRPGRGR